MGHVQYVVIVLMLSAQLVLTNPLINRDDPDNKRCPAGTFQKSSAECEPCPAGSFTNDWNTEYNCHRCFGDCRADYHLKVDQNCSSTSDLKCICEDGYKCTSWVPLSTQHNCRSCELETPPTGMKTPPPLSSGHSTTSASTSRTSCQFPECQETAPPTPSAGAIGHHLTAILCPVVIFGCVILVILLCLCRPGDESCFKRAIAKLCNEERQDASHKSKESSHQFPRDSFSAKQQPPCLSAANLGPVHLHNPGTVILSFLSQFTGHVGSTIEGGKIAETVGSEEEDERDCHVDHPTSSPGIHLSEEERSEDIDSIFFPSQEQGKDCHVSKEEEL